MPPLVRLLAGFLTVLATMATAARAAPDFEDCTLTGSAGQGRAAAQCVRIAVPADLDAPDGDQLELFVARIPALTPEAAADAVTIINGGPGASSIALYVDLQSAFDPLRRERDIVVIDQRGTGRSAPLDCPTLEDASQDYDPAQVRAATRTCLDALRHDPRLFTTSAAVADLEAVRQALGYQQWNLYGVSYGSRVAQHYLQRYPGAVRTLVIDGVVPPGLPLGPDIGPHAQQTLDGILARCAETEYCASAFPDPAAQLAALSARLKQAPIELEIAHPVTGRQEPVQLTYPHLAMTLRLMSYAPETAALIPLIIDEAARRRNYLPLATQALRIEEDLGESLAFAMHNSVVCTEDVPFFGDLSARWPELDATYLGGDQVRALETICEQWPQGRLDPELRQAAPAAAPVLLLSGEFDPITPPAYAEQAAALYPNGRHLLAPGQGHGVIGRGCTPQLVGDFIDSADVQSLDPACLERLGSDAFFVNLLGPPP